MPYSGLLVTGHGEERTVTVEGAVDAARESDLHAAFDKILTDGLRRVVVDLSGVDFVDVAGVRVLVRAHRTAAARGAVLTIRGARAEVAWLLDLVGVGRLLTPPEPD